LKAEIPSKTYRWEHEIGQCISKMYVYIKNKPGKKGTFGMRTNYDESLFQEDLIQIKR